MTKKRKQNKLKQIKDSNEKIFQANEEIVKKYKEYYKQLLTTRKSEITEKAIVEERVIKKSIVTQKTDSRRQEMILTLIKKTMSTMKKRKARDKVGCKAE